MPPIEVLAPLILTILAGVLAGGVRLLDLSGARTLARFVFAAAMPVAIVGFFLNADPSGVPLSFALAYVVSASVCFCIAGLLGRAMLGLTINESGAHALASTCGNSVFLGLPIAFAIEGWGPPFLTLMVMEGLVLFSLATAVMTWRGDGRGAMAKIAASLRQSATRTAANPIVLATIIGIALVAFRVEAPGVVAGFVERFGAVAGPTGLFVLGLYIATLPRAEVAADARNVFLAAVVKLFVFPLLTGGLTYVFTGGDVALTSVSVLFTGLPPAVNTLLQASNYGVYERQIANTIVAATPLGLLTVFGLLAVRSLGGSRSYRGQRVNRVLRGTARRSRPTRRCKPRSPPRNRAPARGQDRGPNPTPPERLLPHGVRSRRGIGRHCAQGLSAARKRTRTTSPTRPFL